MKHLFTIFSFCILSSFPASEIRAQDYLLEQTFLGTRTKLDLLILFGQQVDYDINLYRLKYMTTGIDGLPDTASGLLVLPIVAESTELPIVVYAHGTTSGPTDVPSQLRGGFEIAMAYAAMGFATAAPDFLGLGDSRGFHPYVHAATEASASFDMLNATVEYLEFNAPDWNPNFLFLAGYSQGGHVSAALHRELEANWGFIYPVTAATHMSGPYSISGVMRDLTLSDEAYGFPAYISYIVLGYQSAYGNLYQNLDEIFREPYLEPITNFRDGTINLTTLNNQLISLLQSTGDSIVKKMLHDSIIDRITNDPDDVFNVALRDNDVFEWAPLAPTRLYYCGGDNQVPFENALVAESAMQALGAPDVEAVNLNPDFDHGPCVFPAVLSSIDFFRSFTMPSSTKNTTLANASLHLSPNPATDKVTIHWDAALNGMQCELFDLQGRLMGKYKTAGNVLDISALPTGTYLLVCMAGNEKRMTRLVRQ